LIPNNNMSQQRPTKQKYVILKSFLSLEEQHTLCQEALECHFQHSSEQITIQQPPLLGTASKNLDLGITCGQNVQQNLPFATACIQRAFAEACDFFHEDDDILSVLHKLSNSSSSSNTTATTPLTGLVLLYGPNSFMKAHYDSPTQPGQKNEWLACLSLGETCNFRCNHDILLLESGDALVMDSMSTLHGVEGIVLSAKEPSFKCGLPASCRMGILMWQAKAAPPLSNNPNDNNNNNNNDDKSIELVDGVGNLFLDSDTDTDTDE
jgi:alkylated DNA repair dioxygenase AlkB